MAMKKMLRITGFVFLLLTVVCSVGWSMDFINMSNEELFELRGAIQNAPETDKKAYQVEWDKRVSCMTDEEKKEFTEPSKVDEGNDGKLAQPRVPAQGYEKQSGQGRIIFGGFPKER
jgi:hypothetical protein